MKSRRVVVPFDPSHGACIRAAEFIRDQLPDAELHVLEVTPPPLLGATTEQTTSEHCHRALTDRMTTMNLEPHRTEVRMGSPAEEITRYARDVSADLIVMPSHGRTGIARAFLGSVAEVVVRRAHCSVLVLRLPEE